MNANLLVPAHPARAVQGRVLKLDMPISFWGGVTPTDGRLSDPRSALHGVSIAARVLCIAELRGSSSASSVLLELIYKGLAPAAILIREPDAILALGIFVAREMGLTTPPLCQLGLDGQAAILDGATVCVAEDGFITMMDAA